MSSGGAAGAVPSATDGDSMKRAAVKNLIERYFRQLTEGCGNSDCANPNCFSSGRVEAMTRDRAAAAALQLFKSKSTLCSADGNSPDHHAFKIPRAAPSSASDAGPSSAVTAAPNSVDGRFAASSSPSASSPSAPIAAGHVITVATTSQHATPSPPAVIKSGSPSGGAKSKKVASKLSSGSSIVPKASPSLAAKPVNALDEDKLMEILSVCKATDNYSPLIRTLGETFNNPDSLIASFRKKITVESMSKEDRNTLEGEKDKDTDDLMETEEATEGATTVAEVPMDTTTVAASIGASLGVASTSSASPDAGDRARTR